MKWEFANVWNASLIGSEREIVKRDYIWASELGGSFINRYYKMMGVKPTNPPNMRSLRKFQAGNIWEYVIYNVLKRAGLIISTQNRITHQYDGLLMVSGKQDFIAGGIPDLDRAEAELRDQDLPEILYSSSMAIVNKLREKKLVELEKIVLEIKSSADNMFGMYERANRAADNHYLQAFHYLIGTGMNEAHIVYINKDNCMLLELPLYRSDKSIEDLYRKDIEQMTYFIKNEVVPPKEDEVSFNTQSLSFRINWKIEYSDYLTLIYGYDRPELFREKWDKPIKSWNRVLKRCINGDNMTKGNIEAISDIRKHFPNFDDYVEVGRANKDILINDDNDES